MGEAWTEHKIGGSVLRGAPDLGPFGGPHRRRRRPGSHRGVRTVGHHGWLLRAVDDPRYAERLVSDLRSHHLMFAPRLDRGRDGSRFEHVLLTMEEALRRRRADPTDDDARIQLLASGERLSALVIAHHLRRCGFPAHAVGAEDIGMMLSGTLEADAVDLEQSAQKFDRSILHGIPVITGWLGSGRDGALALLGRGGSDHTATAVAHLPRRSARHLVEGRPWHSSGEPQVGHRHRTDRLCPLRIGSDGRWIGRHGAPSSDRWPLHC